MTESAIAVSANGNYRPAAEADERRWNRPQRTSAEAGGQQPDRSHGQYMVHAAPGMREARIEIELGAVPWMGHRDTGCDEESRGDQKMKGCFRHGV